MARRGRTASPVPRRSAPVRAAPARAPVPAPAPPAAVAAPAPSQGPGLLGQMAATAGGVAIGHTVGHALTGMFSGSGGSEAAAVPAQQAAPVPQQQQSYESTGPCAWEIKQFLDCAGSNADLTLCQGFSQAMQECKLRNNVA